jgi:hypothetical protein
MKRFTAILLKPLDQQHDRDGDFIDPAGVEFDPEEDYTIWNDFSYRVPDDIRGHGRVSRREDGALIVTGELDEGLLGPEPKLAIGVSHDIERNGSSVVAHSTLISIGTTLKHVDPDQPPIDFE